MHGVRVSACGGWVGVEGGVHEIQMGACVWGEWMRVWGGEWCGGWVCMGCK